MNSIGKTESRLEGGE
jgi:hypothetical protein